MGKEPERWNNHYQVGWDEKSQQHNIIGIGFRIALQLRGETIGAASA